MLLIWLCISFAGAFLTAFYFHYGYAFLFMALFLAGCFLFKSRFTNNDHILLKAHIALSLTLRTENHLNGCLDARKFRIFKRRKERDEIVD